MQGVPKLQIMSKDAYVGAANTSKHCGCQLTQEHNSIEYIKSQVVAEGPGGATLSTKGTGGFDSKAQTRRVVSANTAILADHLKKFVGAPGEVCPAPVCRGATHHWGATQPAPSLSATWTMQRVAAILYR